MTADLNPRSCLIGLLLWLAGCTTDTQLPPPGLAELGLADRYGSATVEPQTVPPVSGTQIPVMASASSPLANWWQSFDDPVLDALIERGNSDNFDVQEAAVAAAGRTGRRSGPTGGVPSLATARSKAQATIARTYIGLRARQTLIADDRDFLVQRQALIELARFRAEAGLVPTLDAARAIASRDDMIARISDLEAQNLQDVGQIAMLTGQAPEALRDLVAGNARLPVGPADVALGTRSDLLLRRADIRASAARLATARAVTEQRSATIDYKRAVLQAVQDVELQNTAFQQARLREIDLGRAVATSETATRLARKAYAEGLADYSTLDQVESRLLASRGALRQAQAQRALALIGLYIALGGDRGDKAGETPSATPMPIGGPT